MLIHHPDGYFNVDNVVIPEDVFMDTFPDYPSLPDGVTHRICSEKASNIHSERGQIACPEITSSYLSAIIDAKETLRSLRNTRYPNAFTDHDVDAQESSPLIRFSVTGAFPPVPNPDEVFDPAKRRLAERADSGAGKSPKIVGKVMDNTPTPPTVASRILDAKAEASRRINEVAPVWKQTNALRKNPNNPIFKEIDSIREKSDLIEAHIETLTDAEAGAYDIENSPLWD